LVSRPSLAAGSGCGALSLSLSLSLTQCTVLRLPCALPLFRGTLGSAHPLWARRSSASLPSPANRRRHLRHIGPDLGRGTARSHPGWGTGRTRSHGRQVLGRMWLKPLQLSASACVSCVCTSEASSMPLWSRSKLSNTWDGRCKCACAGKRSSSGTTCVVTHAVGCLSHVT
jgi:hypothetical protein